MKFCNILTSKRTAAKNDRSGISSIGSGKIELIKEELNIAPTISAAIDLAETLRGNKKIDFIVNADPDIPRKLIGDGSRIRQVILNLMNNAVKYTEEGSVTLTISQTRQEYGINLFVSVADTGIGLSEDQLEKVYTSFYRVDTAEKLSVEGTGLSMSKRLIDQMGGFFSVKSKYGKGAEFRFVVPLEVYDRRPFAAVNEPQRVHAAAFLDAKGNGKKIAENLKKMEEMLHVDIIVCSDAQTLRELTECREITHILVSKEKYTENTRLIMELAEISEVYVIGERTDTVILPKNIRCIFRPFDPIAAAAVFNNEYILPECGESEEPRIQFYAPEARVLIVDDNAFNLEVAAELMQSYRMQLFTADSGSKAIEMLQSEDIDLVFMDHIMPDMDGVETTKQIRSKGGEYYRTIPIVALTANTDKDAREMFINEGFTDFLAKPIELEALERILRSYLPSKSVFPKETICGMTDIKMEAMA